MNSEWRFGPQRSLGQRYTWSTTDEPVIPALESGSRRISSRSLLTTQASLGYIRPYPNKRTEAGDVAPVVGCLPGMSETLDLIPRTEGKKI